MFRSRINNLIIALGLVFLYSAVVSITADMKQSFSDSQEISALSSIPSESKRSNPVVEQQSGTKWSISVSEQIAVQQEIDSLTEVVSDEASTPSQGLAYLPVQPVQNASFDIQVENAEAYKHWIADLVVEESVPQADLPEDTAAGGQGNEPPVPEPAAETPVRYERPAVPEIPIRLAIPAIELDAPVVIAETRAGKVAGKKYLQWLVPEKYASGWHETSARLGEVGNTVLNGHHNLHGEVFRRLVDLEVGDIVQVYSEESLFTYVISNKMILPEKYEQLDVRMENARWILPSDDERLTLITCWPYESNTHRLILVASPISYEKLAP